MINLLEPTAFLRQPVWSALGPIGQLSFGVCLHVAFHAAPLLYFLYWIFCFLILSLSLLSFLPWRVEYILLDLWKVCIGKGVIFVCVCDLFSKLSLLYLHSFSGRISVFFYFNFIGVLLIYNVVLVQVYNKVIQLYIYIYLFFFRFFSHIVYQRILSRVPCVIHYTIVGYLSK